MPTLKEMIDLSDRIDAIDLGWVYEHLPSQWPQYQKNEAIFLYRAYLYILMLTKRPAVPSGVIFTTWMVHKESPTYFDDIQSIAPKKKAAGSAPSRQAGAIDKGRG